MCFYHSVLEWLLKGQGNHGMLFLLYRDNRKQCNIAISNIKTYVIYDCIIWTLRHNLFFKNTHFYQHSHSDMTFMRKLFHGKKTIKWSFKNKYCLQLMNNLVPLRTDGNGIKKVEYDCRIKIIKCAIEFNILS